MPGDGTAHRDARIELSQWLVAGREARNLSREHVAQVTRIQLRTIEHLEDGRFEGLPADVFVRGFIRGYARCVGLSVDDALARYGACGFAAAPVASAQAQALLDSMAPLTTSSAAVSASAVVRTGPLARAPRILGEDAPADDDVGAARPAEGAVEVSAPAPIKVAAASSPAMLVPAVIDPVAVTVVETAAVAVEAAAVEPEPRKRKRKVTASPGPAVRDSRGRFVRRTGEMSAQMPAIDAAELAALGFETDAIEVSASSSAELVIPIEIVEEPVVPMVAAAVTAEPNAIAAAVTAEPIPYDAAADLESVLGEPINVAVMGRVTARAIAIPPRTSGILVPPTLVIDDDDPEDAERAREERLAPGGSKRDADKGWRSFLPPALLDQQKGRQGGLTLAVIILLIVATLTLSYLMRRPSSTGEGITEQSAPTLLVG